MTTAEFLQELTQEAPATRRVLERVPEDRYDWRPHEKSFTLGQLAMHLATLPGAIADLGTRGGFDVRTRLSRPAPASAEDLLSAFDRSIAQAKASLGSVSDGSLGDVWRIMDGEREVRAMPRAGVFRTVLFNHWYHHRGQLTVYLRLLNVPLPAIYGPSADEAGM